VACKSRPRNDLLCVWLDVNAYSLSQSLFAKLQLELAEICQHSERYIGTEGGGMDQSISFLAQKGTVSCVRSFASYLNFYRTICFKLPSV